MKLVFLSIFGALSISALPVIANAQNLQNSQTGLQQQTGQTQNTRQLQNQTAPLQTNNPGQVLSQNQVQRLNVVSSPDQQEPDVSVGATATTNSNDQEGSSRTELWQILLVISIVGLVASIVAYRKSSPLPVAVVQEPVVNTPEAQPKKNTKKSGSKKKKKKPHHR